MKLEQRDFRDIFSDPDVDEIFDMLFNSRKKLSINKTPYNNKRYKIFYSSKKEYNENRYGKQKVGYWIDNDDYLTTSYGTLHIYTCSICKAEITIDGYDSYCPNCGAKMEV